MKKRVNWLVVCAAFMFFSVLNASTNEPTCQYSSTERCRAGCPAMTTELFIVLKNGMTLTRNAKELSRSLSPINTPSLYFDINTPDNQIIKALSSIAPIKTCHYGKPLTNTDFYEGRQQSYHEHAQHMRNLYPNDDLWESLVTRPSCH